LSAEIRSEPSVLEMLAESVSTETTVPAVNHANVADDKAIAVTMSMAKADSTAFFLSFIAFLLLN